MVSFGQIWSARKCNILGITQALTLCLTRPRMLHALGASCVYIRQSTLACVITYTCISYACLFVEYIVIFIPCNIAINLVCYAHQIWCASIVQTGTPYRVCTAHHFLVCHAHLNWCAMHTTWCAMHTTLVSYAPHIGVPCTPHWCAMHSTFGVHSTLVKCFIPPILCINM